VELHGNLAVREITQKHVLDYRAFCEKIPDTRGMPQDVKRGDVGSLKNKNGRVITPRTVERHLSSIKALLGWCTTNVPNFGLLNVAQGITSAKDPRRRQEIARGFTPVEMRAIFDNIDVVYDVTRKRYQQRAIDMGWLVRVCAYTGARLEELAQLMRADVRKIGDVWVIDINENSGRRLKNENSVRLVPVHPELLKLGFVEWARNGEGKRVFRSFQPLPARPENTCGHSASSGFGRFLDTLGLTDRAINFHSFRHTFITAMRNARVAYSVELAISGHADNMSPVHGNYGSPAYVKVLFEEIAKVDPMGGEFD
jgi:integrase